MNSRYAEINKRQEEVEKLLFECLKLPRGRTSIVATHNEGGRMSIHIRLSEYFNSYQNSNYYSNSKSFIHFTSYKSALSIISTSFIRLYNLYYKNDKSEFTFASKILKAFNKPTEESFSNIEEATTQIKFNTFILSSTISVYLNDFWRKKYSSRGHGIGIEFSFYNNPLSWNGFFFSPVKYGELEKIKKFRKGLAELKKLNPNVSYMVNINQALAFHKKKKYKNENEIRLLTFTPQKKKFIVYKDTGDENIRFINLQVINSTNNLSEFTSISEIPLLKIECIHFGPKLSNSKKEEIKAILTKKYNYEIKYKNYVA